jgi:VanZ family protein
MDVGREPGANGRLARRLRAIGSLARVLRAIGAGLQRIPRAWAWIPVLAWAGLIFFLSSRPAPHLGGAPNLVGGWLTNSAHGVEYGMLALWSALLVRRRVGWPDLDRRAFTALVVAIALYAASDEWHQSFTPHRDASVCDVITDVVGAACTLAAIAFAGGARASDEKLARVFAYGIPAVLLAGALATFADWFTDPSRV